MAIKNMNSTATIKFVADTNEYKKATEKAFTGTTAMASDVTDAQKNAAQATQIIYGKSLELQKAIASATGDVKKQMQQAHNAMIELLKDLEAVGKSDGAENGTEMTITDINKALLQATETTRLFHREIAAASKASSGFDVKINYPKMQKDLSGFKKQMQSISDIELIDPKNVKTFQAISGEMVTLENRYEQLINLHSKTTDKTILVQIEDQLSITDARMRQNINTAAALKSSYTQALNVSKDSNTIDRVLAKTNLTIDEYVTKAGTAKKQLASFMSSFDNKALSNHIKEIRSYKTQLENLQKVAVPKGDVGYAEYKKELDRLTQLIETKVTAYNKELSHIGDVKTSKLKSIADDLSLEKATHEVEKLQKEIVKLNGLPLIDPTGATNMQSRLAEENNDLIQLSQTLEKLTSKYAALKQQQKQGINVDKDLAETNALLQKTAGLIGTTKKRYVEYAKTVSNAEGLIKKAHTDTRVEFEGIIHSQSKATESLRQFINTRSKLANDDAIAAANKSILKYEASIDNLNITAKEQQDIINATGAAIDKLKQKYQQQMLANKAAGNSDIKLQKEMAATLAQVREEEAKLTKQLARKNSILRQSRTDTKRYSQEISKLKANLAETSGLKRFADIIKRTAMYITGGSMVFAAIATARAITEFTEEADKAARTLSAVLDIQGDVNQRFTQATMIEENLINLTKRYGGTLEDVNSAALELGRAGIPVDKLSAATEAVIKMAKLTGDTVATSASAMVTYTSVFNHLDVDVLGDKLAYVANQSRMSTQDIGTFSNYALATAKTVGLTIDAINGMAIAFSNAGFNASTSGTQIRKFANILNDTSTDTRKFFMEMGTNQSMLAFNIAKGGKESNQAFIEFIRNLQTKTRPAFNKAVAGMDILVKNVLSGLYENGDDVINKLNGSINNSVGELDKALIVTESYTATWEKLKVVLEDFGSKAITPVFDVMQGIANVIIDNKDSITALIKAVALLTVTYASFKVAVLATNKVMSLHNVYLATSFARAVALSSVMKVLSVRLAAVWTAMLANPLGVAVAGIAAMTAGVYLLTEAFDGQLETLADVRDAYGDIQEYLDTAQNNKGIFTADQLGARINKLEEYKKVAKEIVEDERGSYADKVAARKELKALTEQIDATKVSFTKLQEEARRNELAASFSKQQKQITDTIKALNTQKDSALSINPRFDSTKLDAIISQLKAKLAGLKKELTNSLNNAPIITSKDDVDAMKAFTTTLNNIANSTSSSYEAAMQKFDSVMEAFKSKSEVLSKELQPRFNKFTELLKDTKFDTALKDNLEGLFDSFKSNDLGKIGLQVSALKKEIEDLAKANPEWNPDAANGVVKAIEELQAVYGNLGATEAAVKKKADSTTKAYIKGIADRIKLTNDLAAAKALAEGKDYKVSTGIKAQLDASSQILKDLKEKKVSQDIIDAEQLKNYKLQHSYEVAKTSEKEKQENLDRSIKVLQDQLTGKTSTSVELAKVKQETTSKQLKGMLDLKDASLSVLQISEMDKDELLSKIKSGNSYQKVLNMIKDALAAELATNKAITSEQSKYAALDQKRIEQHTAYVAAQQQSLQATKDQYQQLLAFSEVEKQRTDAQVAYSKAVTKAATERDKELARIKQREDAVAKSNADAEDKNKSLVELTKQKKEAQALYNKQLAASRKLLGENLARADEFYKLMETGADSLTNGLVDFFDIGSAGWMDFGSLAKSTIADISKELIKLSVTDPLNSAIKGLISGNSTISNLDQAVAGKEYTNNGDGTWTTTSSVPNLGTGGSAALIGGLSAAGSYMNNGNAGQAIGSGIGTGISTYGAMLSMINPAVGIPMAIGGSLLGGVLGDALGGSKDTTTQDQLKALNEKADARNKYLEAAQTFYDAAGKLGSSFVTAFQSSKDAFNTTMQASLIDNEARRINATTGVMEGERLNPVDFGSVSNAVNFFIEGLQRTLDGADRDFAKVTYSVSELDHAVTASSDSSREFVLAWEDLDSSGNRSLKTLGDAIIELGSNAYKTTSQLMGVIEDYQGMYEKLSGETTFSDKKVVAARDTLESNGVIDFGSASSEAKQLSDILYSIGNAADASGVNLGELSDRIEDNLDAAIAANPELKDLAYNQDGAAKSIEILREKGFVGLAKDVSLLQTVMGQTIDTTGMTFEEILNLNSEMKTMSEVYATSRKNVKAWNEGLKSSDDLMLETASHLGVYGRTSDEAFQLLKGGVDGLTDAEYDYLVQLKAREDASKANIKAWEDRFKSQDDILADSADTFGVVGKTSSEAFDLLKGGVDGLTDAEYNYLDALKVHEEVVASATASFLDYAEQMKGTDSYNSYVKDQQAQLYINKMESAGYEIGSVADVISDFSSINAEGLSKIASTLAEVGLSPEDISALLPTLNDTASNTADTVKAVYDTSTNWSNYSSNTASNISSYRVDYEMQKEFNDNIKKASEKLGISIEDMSKMDAKWIEELNTVFKAVVDIPQSVANQMNQGITWYDNSGILNDFLKDFNYTNSLSGLQEYSQKDFMDKFIKQISMGYDNNGAEEVRYKLNTDAFNEWLKSLNLSIDQFGIDGVHSLEDLKTLGNVIGLDFSSLLDKTTESVDKTSKSIYDFMVTQDEAKDAWKELGLTGEISTSKLDALKSSLDGIEVDSAEYDKVTSAISEIEKYLGGIVDLTDNWLSRNDTTSQSIDKMGNDLEIESASKLSLAQLEAITLTDGLTQAEYDLLSAREEQIKASESNKKAWEDTINPEGSFGRLLESVVSEMAANSAGDTGGLSEYSANMSLDDLYNLLTADGELTDAELALLNARKEQIDKTKELQDKLDIAKLMDDEEGILAETRKQALKGLTEEQAAKQTEIWKYQDALKVLNEKKGLQDQLNKLTLSESELRKIQLDKLDESNREIQTNIWLEEDRQKSLSNINSWLDTIDFGGYEGSFKRLAQSLNMGDVSPNMSLDDMYKDFMSDGKLTDAELALLKARKQQVDVTQGLQDQLDIAKLMDDEEGILAETRKQALKGLTKEQAAKQTEIWKYQDALKVLNEKKGLQDQVNKLTLTESQLRDIQLAKLDKTNQAIQKNIWAEEDRQKSISNINSWLDTIDFDGYEGSFYRLAQSLDMAEVSANMSSDAMFNMFMKDGKLSEAELKLLNARKQQEDITADLAKQEEDKTKGLLDQLDIARMMGDEDGILALNRQKELSTLTEEQKSIQRQIWAYEDATKARDEHTAYMETSWDSYYDRLIREADKAHQSVIDGYNDEINAYQDTIDKKQDMLDDLNDSLSDITDNINTLDSIISSIEDTVKTLRGEDKGLKQLDSFSVYIREAMRLSGSSNYDALSKAVENAVSASSALLDSSNFQSYEDMMYQQSVAANQFDSLDVTLESERDILKEIEENTRMQIAAIEGSIASLRGAISDLSDSIDIKEQEATTSEMVSELTQEFADMKAQREIIKQANGLSFLSPAEIEKYTDANTAKWFRDKFDEINSLAEKLIPTLGGSFSIKTDAGDVRTLEKLAHNLGISTSESRLTTDKRVENLKDDFLEMKSLRDLIASNNDLTFLSPSEIEKYSDKATADWFKNMFASINQQAESLIPELGSEFAINTIYGEKLLENLAHKLGTSTSPSVPVEEPINVEALIGELTHQFSVMKNKREEIKRINELSFLSPAEIAKYSDETTAKWFKDIFNEINGLAKKLIPEVGDNFTILGPDGLPRTLNALAYQAGKSTAASFDTGGYTGNIPANSVAGIVHGQEYVLNAQTTKAMGLNNAGSNVFIEIRDALRDIKQMQIRQTANSNKALDTSRASLSLQLKEA